MKSIITCIADLCIQVSCGAANKH